MRDSFLTKNEDGVDGFMNMMFVFKNSGEVSFTEDACLTRGYARVFNTVEDYNSYYTTGKLADGSTTYYGYDRTMTYDSSNKYYYTGKAARENLVGALSEGEFGRFEASTSGGVLQIKGTGGSALDPYTFFNGEFLNLYLSNGFGAMIQLYDVNA